MNSNLLYFVEGMGIMFLLGLVVYILYCDWKRIETIRIDDPTNDKDFIKTWTERPRCPDCGSFRLCHVNDLQGVPWLESHIPELDRYRCMHCGREFNDEDWKDAKKFVDY